MKKGRDVGMEGESVRDCVHRGSSTCTWLVGAGSTTTRLDRYRNMTVMDVM